MYFGFADVAGLEAWKEQTSLYFIIDVSYVPISLAFLIMSNLSKPIRGLTTRCLELHEDA